MNIQHRAAPSKRVHNEDSLLFLVGRMLEAAATMAASNDADQRRFMLDWMKADVAQTYASLTD